MKVINTVKWWGKVLLATIVFTICQFIFNLDSKGDADETSWE